METSLISIIVPVYNVEKYLRQCLDSVLAQTYMNYEVILIDDGSTDSSYAVCMEYSAKDSRCKTFRKENGGASSARNLGLDKATGEYILFLDSDDWIDKEALVLLYETAKANDVDFVFFEASVTDDTGNEYAGNYRYSKQYRTDAAYKIMRDLIYHKEFHVSVPLLFVKTSFLKQKGLRFCEDIMYEDLILSYQIFASADKAAHLHRTLYHRRYRANSVMTSRITEYHFRSAAAVYREVVKFTERLSEERRSRGHVIRCAFFVLNTFRLLGAEDKKNCQNDLIEIKRDIAAHQAFGSVALKYRCRGYAFWAVYKAAERLFIGDKPDCRIYVNSEAKNKKKVLMLLPHMIGGGAERVAAQLLNQMHTCGTDAKFFISADRRNEVVMSDLDPEIPLFLLREEMPREAIVKKLVRIGAQVLSSLLCKPFELFYKPVPADFAKLSILGQYNREIEFLRDLMRAEPDLTVIAFLQPTIPIALLAARGLPNKVIVSERGDPERLMKKRYGRRFIEKYYLRADAVVFQTGYAKSVYPDRLAEKGIVIPNPLKDGLPAPYRGERNKNITTFCRISRQKNLPLLIDAFALLHKEHADYKLRIIGGVQNAEGDEVLKTICKRIADCGIKDAVMIEPFNAGVHEAVIQDAMYVNSSDYEGISNAMLEAMAIGLPVVCTDCPVGGARATVSDGHNGLLVPVKDPEALYRAMKKLIEHKDLAKRLSYHAPRIRDNLTVEMIAKRWMELI